LLKNLAGYPLCDKYILQELESHGIEPVRCKSNSQGEVCSSLTGRIGKFTFRRDWSYWVITGALPLEYAMAIYANPVGRQYVRAGGDCACRNPEIWENFFDTDGNELYVDPGGKQREQIANLLEKGLLKSTDTDNVIFFESEKERDKHVARSFVNMYHVDSDLGLHLIVDAIRAYLIVDTMKAHLKGTV